MKPIPAEDLDHIMAHMGGLWERLRGKRIFLTGGTGLFGKWLTASFCSANDQLGLDAHLCILTRTPERAKAVVPDIFCHPAVSLVQGDFRSFDYDVGEFSHIIHAANATGPSGEPLQGADVFHGNLAGVQRLLWFASRCGVQRLLNISSGAVYGPRPVISPHIADDAPLDLGVVNHSYPHSKRIGEMLVAIEAERLGFSACSARCFAFVGPWLPLAGRYAIGNFIRDALTGGPIRVHGDGRSMRSYLYMSDLAIWLWTLLLIGRCGEAYNVGYDIPISIGALASMVSAVVGQGAPIIVEGGTNPSWASPYYVPSTAKASQAFGLQALVSLPDAIARTAAWYRESGR